MFTDASTVSAKAHDKLDSSRRAIDSALACERWMLQPITVHKTTSNTPKKTVKKTRGDLCPPFSGSAGNGLNLMRREYLRQWAAGAAFRRHWDHRPCQTR
ncbi:MAG: hypothetical protein ACOYNF_09880, partial [Rhodoferax sp.]